MRLNPLLDPCTDNMEIDENVQKMINTDLKTDDYCDEDRTFVEMILKLVSDKVIDLHKPASLLNQSIYERLSHEAQGLADQNAIVMLAKIRQIVNLSKIYSHPTYQMINLVASLRQNKENMEKHSGDLFII